MVNSKDMKKKKAYEFFEMKCVKMIESKFLLAQPCITGVLKCIIGSPELYQFIKDTISNIDCDAELAKATLDTNNRFRMPESKRVLIALVTYLLNQFDNNDIDLMEFIAYYYNPDTNIGYQVFCQEVIAPYCIAVRELFTGDIVQEDQESEDEPIRVNSAVFEQADVILKDIFTELQADNSLSDNERKEMRSLVEGMMIALSNLDSKIIIALWIGMKYAFNRNRRIMKSLRELERLFTTYMII